MIRVIDASVAVKWFLNESDSGPAREILREIGDTPRAFAVPELFYYEVYAVCMREHPKPELFAEKGMPILFNVPCTRVPMTNDLAMQGAAFVAAGLTGYDAVYAALTKQLEGIWITYDKAAAKRLGMPKWIRVLNAY
ncbi:MAG: type II toxin-antitoxin system VapC family toxin [Deltaproteobacteria bacterium]|nr:type II toxin-antitoxin system VapC family toxin [Deltaproteobacteria bacterium]MBI3295633.1 type II toxin-antitoxin system VapC family toxin [Deltaproteobacteria bacterium]